VKRILAVWVAVVLGLVCITGCASKKGQTVAQVGKDKITVGELSEQYVDMKVNSSIKIISEKPEYEQLKDFLEQRIDSKLLIQAAYEKGFDKDPVIEGQTEQEKEKLLLNVLFNKEIISKVKATDRDVKDYYKKLGERIKVRHILVKTKKEADQIYQALREGADFDSLAMEKSIDPRTKDRGGDLGYITWNAMLGATSFKEVAFKLKPQEISRPVKTLSGWHVIRLDEKRKETQKSFEEEKERLRESLQLMKQQEAGINFMVNLMEQTDIKMASSSREMLEEKAKILAGTDTLGAKTREVNIDPDRLSEEERSLPFLKYKGGELSVDEFLRFYNRWPSFQRPPLEDEETLKGMIFNYLLAPKVLKKVAQQKRIDKSKEYEDKVRRYKERLMAEKYRNEVIWKDLTTEQSDLEGFYQRNIDKYIAPAQAHVLEILVRTEKEAQTILQQLRSGADFKELAREKTLRASAKNRGGDLGDITQNSYPELFEAAFRLKKGELGGPVHLLQGPAGEGHSVIKLLEKNEQRQKTLEEVEPQVRSGATMEKKNNVSRQWVAEVRAKTEIKINESALEAAFKIVEKELPPERKRT